MRILISAVCLVLAAGSAAAETVQLNHLDCIPDDRTGELVCPNVLDGRNAAPETAPNSAERNAQCAAKYRSFDAATGLYKSYSGKMKPCRL